MRTRGDPGKSLNKNLPKKIKGGWGGAIRVSGSYIQKTDKQSDRRIDKHDDI